MASKFEMVQAALASGEARVFATSRSKSDTTQLVTWNDAAYFYDERRQSSWKCDRPYAVAKGSPAIWNIVGEVPPQEKDAFDPFPGFQY